MRTTKEAIEVIKALEGFSADPYEDAAGILTIGYGTANKRATPIDRNTRVTEKQAEAMLLKDVQEIEMGIQRAFNMDKISFKQHEFDALVCLVYNVGIGAFRKSKLKKKITEGDKTGAANEFDDWVKAGGVRLAGLVIRRAVEKDMFLNGTYNLRPYARR